MDSDISTPHSENVYNAFRELIKREMPIQIIDTLEIESKIFNLINFQLIISFKFYHCIYVWGHRFYYFTPNIVLKYLPN